MLFSVSTAIPAKGQFTEDRVFGFLELTGSARSAGLGGNHVALADGGVSLFTANPAYLTDRAHKEVSFSYLNHLSDIYLATVDFAYHLDQLGTFASGIRYLNYGDMQRTTRDGARIGTFNAYDFSWSFAFSREWLPSLTAGIGTQLIASSYDDYQSTGVAFFGGLMYTFNEGNTIAGLSFQHLGTQLTTYDGTREELPFTITAGISHRLNHLPLRFNLALHSLNKWEIPVYDDDSPGFADYLFRHVRLGTEILFSKHAHLRLGYDHLKNQSLKSDKRLDFAGASIGLGIMVYSIHMDISRSSFSESGGITQISLSKNF
ncbi:type IX secretion system protein PorQ [Balneolaceae bacterium ANBcel3]|nr:type IX secretion system protein PorQ [Balneolaceae bacterium ANBcel3]